MWAQPIGEVVSSSPTGNESIAEFSLGVREGLQARELPQKLVVVILLSLLLESLFAISVLHSMPSALFGCQWNGDQVHF